MINSKEEYLNYLICDKVALGKKYDAPKIVGDEIWRFERQLRKAEYYKNCKKGIIGKILSALAQYRYHKMRLKLGISIPLNVFGPGLSIAHYGTIVVNGNCIVGKNCRIQEGVTIGATNGSSKAPQLGDNVFLGSGAKVIGDIVIEDDVAIGANAVVVKSVKTRGVTLAGVPAKIVSENNSHSNLMPLLNELELL